MAVFVIPDVGLSLQLAENIVQMNSGGSTVRLFKNDYTPDGSTIFGSFVEPTWTDYAPQNPVFNAPALSANIAYSDTDEMEFDCNSDPSTDLVYGYFVLDNDNISVRFCERFTDPVTPIEGQPIRLTIRYRFRNPS